MSYRIIHKGNDIDVHAFIHLFITHPFIYPSKHLLSSCCMLSLFWPKNLKQKKPKRNKFGWRRKKPIKDTDIFRHLGEELSGPGKWP